MIIVIFLITLITGAIGYNMKGALDRGRVFRTEQAALELRDLLMLAVAEGNSMANVAKEPEQFLRGLGLAKDPKKLLEDGWGQKFHVTVDSSGEEFSIVSDLYEKHKKKS